MLAHFISVGLASQKLLQASGYAFGLVMGLSHSDRDKEFGEELGRADWFPMAIFLDVMEEGPDEGQGQDDSKEVTARYELSLDYNPKAFADPGLVILEAWKLDADGGPPVSLEVLPPVPKGFLERHRKGITMMFGVIIASSAVKFMRRCIERLARKAKQDEEKEASAAAASTEKTGAPKKGNNPKKKAGNPKED
eukprot:jgi/Undpi1/2264/HiC_scaffold_13.g05650.m1